MSGCVPRGHRRLAAACALLAAAVAAATALHAARAQEPERTGEAAREPEGEERPPRHKLGFLQATSWVPEGRNPDTGEKQTVLAPTYGLAYEY